MLTHKGCLARRERLWEAVAKQDETVEWVLVADPRHVQYLANFWVQPLSFSGGERGLLLLERDGPATLFADNFAFRSAAHPPFVDREIIEPWYDHKHSVINRDHALVAALSKSAGDLQGRPGMVESEWLPVSAAETLDHSAIVTATPSVGSILRGLRRHKDADEIELIRECCLAGEAGQRRLRKVLGAGTSEFKIYREVQKAALKAAGRPALVYGDFRANNAKNPKTGGLPTDYKLQKGDLFVLDYSVVLDGYRCDFTNTMCVGQPSKEVLKHFEICQSAMAAGERSLQAGTKARDVHAAVMEPFREAGLAQYFPHHAGHGIGLAHPEPPVLVPESDDVLIAGDVVTLEPGVYKEGVGGMRIEHNYLITETGCERLSHHDISLT